MAGARRLQAQNAHTGHEHAVLIEKLPQEDQQLLVALDLFQGVGQVGVVGFMHVVEERREAVEDEVEVFALAQLAQIPGTRAVTRPCDDVRVAAAPALTRASRMGGGARRMLSGDTPDSAAATATAATSIRALTSETRSVVGSGWRSDALPPPRPFPCH